MARICLVHYVCSQRPDGVDTHDIGIDFVERHSQEGDTRDVECVDKQALPAFHDSCALTGPRHASNIWPRIFLTESAQRHGVVMFMRNFIFTSGVHIISSA